MKIKKIELLINMVGICILILGFIYSQDFFPILLVILAYLYIGWLVKSKSSVHMMFFLGYSTFIFLPALFNWYFLNTNLSLFFTTSFVSVFFLFFTKHTKVNFFIDYGKSVKQLFIFFSFLSILFVFIGLGWIVTYTFSFLIILLSLCFKQGLIKNNSIYLLVFAVVFFVYMLFYWSGLGRTVVMGWLLLALLQFSYSIGFNVNKYVFGLLPGLAAALLTNRNLLQLSFSGFEEALYDSAYGPYRLASSFIEDFNQRGFDVPGFLDQMLFTFFVYIPREIWSTKPYGFGFEYTVRHLDAYLIDAGHSIAGTLIGMHIYYLGYIGIFTSLIFYLIIAFATNLLYKMRGLNGNGVLVFSSSMMVLVWGGGTSFSARVVFPCFIFVMFFILFRPILTRRVKFSWR